MTTEKPPQKPSLDIARYSLGGEITLVGEPQTLILIRVKTPGKRHGRCVLLLTLHQEPHGVYWFPLGSITVDQWMLPDPSRVSFSTSSSPSEQVGIDDCHPDL